METKKAKRAKERKKAKHLPSLSFLKSGPARAKSLSAK
jgi:hypothetical protein